MQLSKRCQSPIQSRIIAKTRVSNGAAAWPARQGAERIRSRWEPRLREYPRRLGGLPVILSRRTMRTVVIHCAPSKAFLYGQDPQKTRTLTQNAFG